MFNKEQYEKNERDLFIRGFGRCEHEQTVMQLSAQSERIDKFIEEVEPLMDFIRAEIKKNERRAKLYDKVIESMLGAVVIGTLGFFGSFILSLVKSKYHLGE